MTFLRRLGRMLGILKPVNPTPPQYRHPTCEDYARIREMPGYAAVAARLARARALAESEKRKGGAA